MLFRLVSHSQNCRTSPTYRLIQDHDNIRRATTAVSVLAEGPSIDDDSHIAVTVTAQRRYNLRRPRQRRKRKVTV